MDKDLQAIMDAMVTSFDMNDIVDSLIAVTAMRGAIAQEKGDVWESKKWNWHAARFREVKLQNYIHSNKAA